MADDPQPSTSSAACSQSASSDPDQRILNTENDFYGEYVPRHLYTCEIANMYNLSKIVRELDTRERCIKFSIDYGLVPNEKLCRYHRKPKRIEYGQNKNVGSFVCNRGTCRSRSRVARGKGTWFENVKLSLPHVFYLMYCFAHRKPYHEVIHEDPEKSVEGCLSAATVSDWYSYCRETVVIYQLDHQSSIGKIGGPGKIVQIDESKFGKRKYRRHIEGHWVLGMIEDGCEDLRLEVCPDNSRSADILIPLIKKHVAEGTTIHTDHWRGYNCLGKHVYTHKRVSIPTLTTHSSQQIGLTLKELSLSGGW